MTVFLLSIGFVSLLVLGFLVSLDARAAVTDQADPHCRACDGRGWVYFGATCEECGASAARGDTP